VSAVTVIAGRTWNASPATVAGVRIGRGAAPWLIDVILADPVTITTNFAWFYDLIRHVQNTAPGQSAPPFQFGSPIV